MQNIIQNNITAKNLLTMCETVTDNIELMIIIVQAFIMQYICLITS